VAKGRKPQFSLDDLLGFLTRLSGGSQGPVDARTAQALDAQRKAIEVWQRTYNPKNIGRQGNQLNAIYEWLTPMGFVTSAEEGRRLVTKGPDEDIAKSVLLSLALIKSPQIVKGAIRGYRGTKELLRGAGMSPQRAKLPAAKDIQKYRE
jgi:hypothetical protein